MSDIAAITITGRLGRDPETVTTQSGSLMLKFSVANTTGWGDRKRTNWYPVTVFGKRAEGLATLARRGELREGSQVTVAGTLSPRPYESNGKSGLSLDLDAQEVSIAWASKTESDVPF